MCKLLCKNDCTQILKCSIDLPSTVPSLYINTIHSELLSMDPLATQRQFDFKIIMITQTRVLLMFTVHHTSSVKFEALGSSS